MIDVLKFYPYKVQGMGTTKCETEYLTTRKQVKQNAYSGFFSIKLEVLDILIKFLLECLIYLLKSSRSIPVTIMILFAHTP